MRFFACLFVLLFAFLTPAPIIAQEQKRDSYETIAKAFLEAMRSEDFKKLEVLLPPPSVYRALSPRETANLSDQRMRETIKKTIIPKLRADFDNILKGAKERNITLSKLEFVKASPVIMGSDKSLVKGLEVHYAYDGKNGNFALAVADFRGTFYLVEILLSYDVFRKLSQ